MAYCAEGKPHFDDSPSVSNYVSIVVHFIFIGWHYPFWSFLIAGFSLTWTKNERFYSLMSSSVLGELLLTIGKVDPDLSTEFFKNLVVKTQMAELKNSNTRNSSMKSKQVHLLSVHLFSSDR